MPVRMTCLAIFRASEFWCAGREFRYDISPVMAEPVEGRVSEVGDPGVCKNQERNQQYKQCDYVFRHQKCTNFSGSL